MNTETIPMIRNESRAKSFLMENGILRTTRPCTRCGSARIEPAGRGRSRCRDCGFVRGLRQGSIIENTHTTCLQFIRIARCFADDVSPGDAAERLGTDIATVNRMYHRIRRSLLNGPAGTAVTQGHKANPDTMIAIPDYPVVSHGGYPVSFGIRTLHDTVSIDPLDPETPDILAALEIPRIIRGNILFIDVREKNYHGLIAYLPNSMNQQTIVYRPKNREPWPPLMVFWKYAETVWSHHRYMERAQIPEFVQELAFRYNHRHMDMFHAIIGMISQHDYEE